MNEITGPDFEEEKWKVLHRVIAGGVITIAVFAATWLLWPNTTTPDTFEGSIVLAANCLLLPAMCLALATLRIVRYRNFNAGAIDGSNPPGDKTLEIMRKQLTNTLEQAALAGLIWPALALNLPAAALNILPVAAVQFLIGRILFFHGYPKGGSHRALGFALTFHQNLACLLLAAWFGLLSL